MLLPCPLVGCVLSLMVEHFTTLSAALIDGTLEVLSFPECRVAIRFAVHRNRGQFSSLNTAMVPARTGSEVDAFHLLYC